MNNARLYFDSLSRISDDDWVGVCCMVGDLRRISVNAAGTRYAFQQLVLPTANDPCPQWAGPSYRTLAALVAKNSAEWPELLDLPHAPDDPSLAFPALKAANGEMLSAFSANDWRRDDYERVICCPSNLRLAVSPDGLNYLVQLLDPRTSIENGVGSAVRKWLTKFSAPDVNSVRNYVTDAVAVSGYWSPYADPDPHNSPVILAILSALDDLPSLAADGDWPVLPERPETIHGN